MSGSHCFSVRFDEDGRATSTTLPGARGRLLLARINKEKLPRKLKKQLRKAEDYALSRDGYHCSVRYRRGREPSFTFGMPQRYRDAPTVTLGHAESPALTELKDAAAALAASADRLRNENKETT